MRSFHAATAIKENTVLSLLSSEVMQPLQPLSTRSLVRPRHPHHPHHEQSHPSVLNLYFITSTIHHEYLPSTLPHHHGVQAIKFYHIYKRSCSFISPLSLLSEQRIIHPLPSHEKQTKANILSLQPRTVIPRRM
jgi:hypothetical protein